MNKAFYWIIALIVVVMVVLGYVRVHGL